jgi:DNA-binding CsgD family transcriptional regulator
MSLRLSGADQNRVSTALAALVSPLRHPDLEVWCARVNRTVKRALAADKCSIALVGGRVSYAAFADGLDLAAVRSYPSEVEEISQRLKLWERQVRLGVFNRETMLGDDAPVFYQSAYWNEYIVKIRAFDALGATVRLHGAQGEEALATILLHHDSPTGRSFGTRCHSMLRLLFPAFKAGIEHWSRLHALQERFVANLDATGDAMVLVGGGDRVLHQTPALQSLLGSEPQADSLLGEAHALARAILLLVDAPAEALARQERSPPARLVRLCGGAYRLRGTLAPLDVCDGSACLITVERAEQGVPDTSVLQAHFGLTRKQSVVARLLAQGYSNGQIAKSLFLSPHTAHHHTEQVLLKLGVDSRAKVAARLVSFAGQTSGSPSG